MYDTYGRKIDYVRLSVIDRCNYRCRYCMPEEGIELLHHDDILTFEEIQILLEELVRLGICKVKLTGGEPLVRKNIDTLVGIIHNIDGINDITMTSNGYYLKKYAKLLHDNGLNSINVSIDTLDNEKYKYICRRDGLNEVIDGIVEAIKCGLKVKLNATIAEYTDKDTVYALLDFGLKYKIPIRFIEMMPIGIGKINDLISDDILNIVKEKYDVQAVNENLGNGPAYYYRYATHGILGFISAVHHKFCSSCNRIRISADGHIRACLGHDTEIDLKSILRDTSLDDTQKRNKLRDLLKDTVFNKPCGHSFAKEDDYKKGSIKTMNKIGG